MSDKKQTIFRTHKEPGDFFQMDKYPINDETISWKAKGIHAYFMSLPPDWTIYLDEVKKHATDGKGSLSSGIKELKEAGYMHKLILRNKKGIITGTEWHVYERPHAGPTENQLSESGLSSNGLSESGKPATTNNDSLTNNDDTENDDTAKHPHLRAFTDVYGKFKTEGDAIRLHEFYLQVGPRVYKEILDWIIKKDKDGEQLAIVGAMESAAVKWNTKKFDNTATPQQDEDKNPPGKVR